MCGMQEKTSPRSPKNGKKRAAGYVPKARLILVPSDRIDQRRSKCEGTEMDGSGEKTIAVIGAGPAGLFACDRLLEKGFSVSLFDHMSAPGRKLLVAGSRGGLNITNSAFPADFAGRYGAERDRFSRLLDFFSPADLRVWLAGLGIGTVSGSGGKIFPADVPTEELLDRWMRRLRNFPGFSFYPSHRFTGIRAPGELTLCTPIFTAGAETLAFDASAVILALGGASWPRTGSDGLWTETLREKGILIAEFRSANCGWEASWSPFLAGKFTHVPLKNIALTVAEHTVRGEILLTPYGIEGGPVYALGAVIRGEMDRTGTCAVFLDFLPDWTIEKIRDRLAGGPGKESLATFFRKKLGIEGTAFALVRGGASGENLRESAAAAALVKHFPVTLLRSRPLVEAISSAGGVRFDGVDESLMLSRLPGWFCAGEMLDWESPTGGFLLQGCFSTAARAADGAAAWIAAGTGAGTATN